MIYLISSLVTYSSVDNHSLRYSLLVTIIITGTTCCNLLQRTASLKGIKDWKTLQWQFGTVWYGGYELIKKRHNFRIKLLIRGSVQTVLPFIPSIALSTDFPVIKFLRIFLLHHQLPFLHLLEFCFASRDVFHEKNQIVCLPGNSLSNSYFCPFFFFFKLWCISSRLIRVISEISLAEYKSWSLHDNRWSVC